MLHLLALEREPGRRSQPRPRGHPGGDGHRSRGADAHKLHPEAVYLDLRGLSHTRRNNEADIDQAIALLERIGRLASRCSIPMQVYLAMAYANKVDDLPAERIAMGREGVCRGPKGRSLLDADAPEAHYVCADHVVDAVARLSEPGGARGAPTGARGRPGLRRGLASALRPTRCTSDIWTPQSATWNQAPSINRAPRPRAVPFWSHSCLPAEVRGCDQLR